MRRAIPCTTLLVLVLVLAGCGQRGDLYFPEAERDAVITVPAQLPVTPPDDDAEQTTTPAIPAAGGAGNAPANAGQ